MHTLFSKDIRALEYAARTIRPKIQRLLPSFLQSILDVETTYPIKQVPCDIGEVERPLTYLDSMQIDRSVPVVKETHGGYEEGKRRVIRLLRERLERYADKRNTPELAGTSELSAYLHFGQISVQQLAWEVEHYLPEGADNRYIDESGWKDA